MHAYPSIGGAVSRAAVVAEDAGPSEGLKMLGMIDFDGLDTYQPFHAVRAHCLAQLDRTAEAAEAYVKALSLCTDRPSTLWLEKKISDLRKKMLVTCRLAASVFVVWAEGKKNASCQLRKGPNP